MRIGERGALYLVRYKIRIVGGQDPLYKSSDVEKRKVEKEDPIRRKLFSLSLSLPENLCLFLVWVSWISLSDPEIQGFVWKLEETSSFLFVFSLCLIKPTKGKREGYACWELGIYREMEGEYCD